MTKTSQKSFRDFEYEGWQKAASSYSGTFDKLTEQAVTPLLSKLHISKGNKLLDIACGPGFLTKKAQEYGVQVTGVDFSPGMIALAKSSYPNIDFQMGDAEHLSFPDNSFEYVVSNFGLLHFSKPEIALKEMARVSRKNAQLACTIWDTLERAVAFRLVLAVVGEFEKKQPVLPDGPGMFQFAEKSFARKILQEAGWRNIEFTHLPLIWSLNSASELIEILRTSTVRMASRLNNQSDEVLEKIKIRLDECLQSYKNKSDQIRVPQGALLITAQKDE